MLARLFLLFTTVTLVELALLVQIGRWTSVSFTIALVLLTGALSAFLVKREGLKALARVRSDMAAGKPPGAAAVDGILILVAGAVLLTPGLLTDLFGLSLLIPRVRAAIRAALMEAFKRRVRVQVQTFAHQARSRAEPPHPNRDVVDGDVIDVEYERIGES